MPSAYNMGVVYPGSVHHDFFGGDIRESFPLLWSQRDITTKKNYLDFFSLALLYAQSWSAPIIAFVYIKNTLFWNYHNANGRCSTKIIAFSLEDVSLDKEKIPTITPPKQMQSLLFYWL